ncbi:MAG: 8-oxo-(d)GTP phosphatase [Actinomycetota bacterium]|jgi:8-oxo-dGTP diphosphatase|nr:8-oxo-(d)GTP phosphatase [Actinomycetota bacterium]
MTEAPPVLAAGAVCWRIVGGKVRILLVNRTQHKDTSLPKGKVDPGELLPQTAVREIAEETGLTVGLGAPLGEVRYTIPSGRNKIVYYWSAEVDAHALETARFRPNDEIASLEWVSISKARTRLTYPHDVDIVNAFSERWKSGRARTFAIIVVRHGKAVPAEAWDGPDATRPLLLRGTAQATEIAPGIAAYLPEKILTSTAARCVATIAPLATLTGIKPKPVACLSQDAYESDEAAIAQILAKRMKSKKSAVLCSHGPVIPEIIRELATLTTTAHTSDVAELAALSTGEFSVLHISAQHPRSGFVAMETHSPSAQ